MHSCTLGKTMEGHIHMVQFCYALVHPDIFACENLNMHSCTLGNTNNGAGVENIFLFLGPQSEIEKFSARQTRNKGNC